LKNIIITKTTSLIIILGMIFILCLIDFVDSFYKGLALVQSHLSSGEEALRYSIDIIGLFICISVIILCIIIKVIKKLIKVKRES
jgi:thiamine transporter ThiT